MQTANTKANLSVSLIQTDLHWQDTIANLNMLKEKIQGLSGKTDLVILPEMFSTGFSMNPEKYAEDWPGKTLQWMLLHSENSELAICGSIMVKENGQFYNRFVWTESSGRVFTYDKRHLFRMGGEHDIYNGGNEKLIIEYMGWKIVPFICYDLRFPVWSRNTTNYDFALYVANWPAARSAVWQKLLMARAIENQCYVAGVNRVGTDGNGIDYSGNSLLIDARGEIIHELTGQEEFTYTLESSLLEEFREKFPVFLDADKFTIEK